MAKHRKKTNKNVPAKGRLRDMADKLWSLAIKHDWANRCAICGRSNGILNSHHLIAREHYKLRFDLRNGICLCQHCHQFCPKLSPHQNGLAFRGWLAMRHPRTNEWVEEQIESGYSFEGTRDAWYFVEVLKKLRQYAEPDDFERIVGVRFSEYLFDNPSQKD